MIRRFTRGCLLVGVVALTLLAAPREGQATWNWNPFGPGGIFGPPATYTVAYAPAYASCTPCQTQVCNYVPQTQYRAQYINVPVTTYRPVMSSDPCTGCRVTCMRPTTTMVQQVRYVPYTSYRVACSPVVTNVYSTSVCATSACSTGACETTALSTAVAPCSPSPTPSSYYDGAPSTGASPRTFQEGAESPRLKPVPDDEINGGGENPGAHDASSGPHLQSADYNTASMPVHRAWSYSPVSWNKPRTTPAADVSTDANADDAGWRASSR